MSKKMFSTTTGKATMQNKQMTNNVQEHDICHCLGPSPD
jgi:hypothetical protein